MVGTMKRRSLEIVEMLARRGVDICCIKESRWPLWSARINEGKDTIYKFSWKRDDAGVFVVEVLGASKWFDEVTFILRIDGCLMEISLVVENHFWTYVVVDLK